MIRALRQTEGDASEDDVSIHTHTHTHAVMVLCNRGGSHTVTARKYSDTFIMKRRQKYINAI